MKRITMGSRLGAVSSRQEAVGSRLGGRLEAGSRFGRYKDLERHEVRKLEVTGQSFSERVQKAREMLGSMIPEQVKQVMEFYRDLTVFEALALAQREGKLIVPND